MKRVKAIDLKIGDIIIREKDKKELKILSIHPSKFTTISSIWFHCTNNERINFVIDENVEIK